jgi:hypothetical protein
MRIRTTLYVLKFFMLAHRRGVFPIGGFLVGTGLSGGVFQFFLSRFCAIQFMQQLSQCALRIVDFPQIDRPSGEIVEDARPLFRQFVPATIQPARMFGAFLLALPFPVRPPQVIGFCQQLPQILYMRKSV